MILFYYHIESFHASVSVQQVLAPEQPNLLSCAFGTCKTIGNHQSTKYSRSVQLRIDQDHDPLFWITKRVSIYVNSFSALIPNPWQEDNTKNQYKYKNYPFLSSLATSPWIHRLHTCSTKTIVTTLILVIITLTNLASPSTTTKMSYNGWIMRYLSKILMRSSTITCLLISTIIYVFKKKITCLIKSLMSNMNS